jgi:hypothetical protein
VTIYYGRSDDGTIAPINVLERLWRNSFGESDDECWLYSGKGSKAGHARIRLDDKTRMMVHRLAYEAHHASPIPKGLQVNHHCDNPKCFNPNHLYLGTQSDNMRDKFKRNRDNSPKKIPINQIDYIVNSQKTAKELAKQFNVTPEAIFYHRRKKNLSFQGKG